MICGEGLRMIKVLLCCGAGFSSSALTKHAKNQIVEKGYSEKMSIEFSPLSLSLEVMDDYDIVICCPHLKSSCDKFLKDNQVHIPIYLLPPRMYGYMDIEEIYQDCIDIIEMFQSGHQNPVHFEGEENVMKIQRMKAFSHSFQKNRGGQK